MKSLRLLALALVLFGCSYSRYASPHQAYTPLLDHAGQVDLAASAGGMEQMVSTVSARAAYSPVSNFSIVGGYDGDLERSDANPTEHHAASLGIGTYMRDRITRLEAMAIVGAGYAWGEAVGSTSTSGINYALDGAYAQPTLQFAVGFEVPYFEFAGGVRVGGQFGDVHYRQRAGTMTSGPTEGTSSFGVFMVDHFITLRVPIEIVRFEVTAGWAGVFLGTNIFSSELPSRAYLTGGIGFQFDTMPTEAYVDDTTVVAPDEPDPDPAWVDPSAPPPSYTTP